MKKRSLPGLTKIPLIKLKDCRIGYMNKVRNEKSETGERQRQRHREKERVYV